MQSVANCDSFGMLVVIVNADNIGGDALPAIISYHGARGVERFRQMIESLYIVPLRRTVGKVGHAPAFVERHPSDNARMAPIARDGLGPLVRQPLDGIPGEAIGAGHLLPYQES